MENKPIEKPKDFISDLTQLNNLEFYNSYNKNIAINYIRFLNNIKSDK